jgi:hypothetical protein
MVKKTDDSPALASIGIDIGKDVFHIVGFSLDGKIVLRRKIKRFSLVGVFEKLPTCVVGMEACLSAHFVSRTLRVLGFEPRIIPAIYVKPFVKGQKNDYNDAEAIAEAALRPNLRFVQEKTQDQLDLQACHRVRSRLVSRRTATGVTTHGDDQSDTGLFNRTGDCHSDGRACFAQVTVYHSAEPCRRDLAAHEGSDRRALRRLAVA